MPLWYWFCSLPPLRFVTRPEEPKVDRTTPVWKAREALIARAQVLSADPPAQPLVPGNASLVLTSCRFLPKDASGTTPKFECRAENGDVLKVKYGWSVERKAEVAATRLLKALGFAADDVWMVERVVCHGCPLWPFELRLLAEQFFLDSAFNYFFSGTRPREFRWASVERKLEGRPVEVDGFKGWDWRELPLVNSSAGGATRAELDALRLVAVFLAHWDNKNTNQRLICAGSAEDDCRRPVLMLQDVGATFGPDKVKHEAWSALPIWKDPASCVVSMETLPYKGVLFEPVQISEAGRLLLADRLHALSTPQIRTLFVEAHFPGNITAWVSTFEQKVREIANRPPCLP